MALLRQSVFSRLAGYEDTNDAERLAHDPAIRAVVHFYNGRGTAERWIKEGKYALNWTRLSCHRFVANAVRLQLFVLAFNLGNFLRRLTLLKEIRNWSLRSVQVKLVNTGARMVRHARQIPLRWQRWRFRKSCLRRCWSVSTG